MSQTKSTQLKLLSAPAEIQAFIDGYNFAYSSKKLRNKHALKAETLRGYDCVFGIVRKGEIVAGFIVNNFPHRCLEDFSEQEKQDIIRKFDGINYVSEVVAIWKSKKLSRFMLWSYITFATLFYGRKYIFGCAYKGHGMTKNYYLLSPQMLRQGKKEDDLEVFCYTRPQFFLSFIFGAVKAVLSKLTVKPTSARVRSNERT